MGQLLYLNNVIASFTHLTAPHIAKGKKGTPKFQIDFIIEPNSSTWQDVMSTVTAVAAEAWKDKAQAVLQYVSADKKVRCYGQGDEKISASTMQVLNGYAGKAYVNAKRQQKPIMIRADGSQCMPDKEPIEWMDLAGRIYGGCYVNAAIDIYASKENQGIFGGLIAVQFLADGEPLGNTEPDVTGMFGAVAPQPQGVPTPAGAATPAPQPSFGQPQSPADPNMPAAPFPAKPSFLG